MLRSANFYNMQLSDKTYGFLLCPKNSALSQRIEKQCNTFTRWGSWNIGVAFQIKKIVETNKIDIIHLHDSHALNYFLFAYYFCSVRVAVIFHKHTSFLKKAWLTKWKYNHPAIQKIIAVNHQVKNIINLINKFNLLNKNTALVIFNIYRIKITYFVYFFTSFDVKI